MVTERPPVKRKALAEFMASDRNCTLELPQDNRLRATAEAIGNVLESGQCAPVRVACSDFLTTAAEFYKVPKLSIRVLASRPLRVREGGWATELFGDYYPEKLVMRVWMRTAVRKQVTSFGTFLHTLCHEFCHHLDFTRFEFADSPHTRGFYERTAILYHHARGTPRKKLFWAPMARDRWRIDWQRTKSGG